MKLIKRIFKKRPIKCWALLWGTTFPIIGTCKHVRYCATEEEAKIFYEDIWNAIPYTKSLVEPTIHDLSDPDQEKEFQMRLKHLY